MKLGLKNAILNCQFGSPTTNITRTFNNPLPSVFAILSSISGINSSATIGCSNTGFLEYSSSSSFLFFFFRLNLIDFPSTTRDKSSTASASSSYSESSPLSAFLTTKIFKEVEDQIQRYFIISYTALAPCQSRKENFMK